MSFEKEHMAILQNIESAIIRVYRHEPGLIDYDVEEALDSLISDYKAEQQHFDPKPHRLTDKPEQIYTSVKRICEWLMDRVSLEPDSPGTAEEKPEPITADELIACLKRIKKSVQFWRKRGGRQGYLNFAGHYIA